MFLIVRKIYLFLYRIHVKIENEIVSGKRVRVKVKIPDMP